MHIRNPGGFDAETYGHGQVGLPKNIFAAYGCPLVIPTAVNIAAHRLGYFGFQHSLYYIIKYEYVAKHFKLLNRRIVNESGNMCYYLHYTDPG